VAQVVKTSQSQAVQQQAGEAEGSRGYARAALRGLSFDTQAAMLAPVQRREVQREEQQAKKVGETVKMMALNAIINSSLAKVDETIVTTNTLRLKVVPREQFELAWQNYVDREGRPGSRHEESMRGFVDTSYPGGEMGFVLEGSGQGTLIHEALHQKTAAAFEAATSGWMKEGTTELFTRVVLGYLGSTENRSAYAEAYVALLRLQARAGLAAVAKWYFKGDRGEVDKAVGASKVDSFASFLAASDATSAINSLG
jgi:hypothetical protein